MTLAELLKSTLIDARIRSMRVDAHGTARERSTSDDPSHRSVDDGDRLMFEAESIGLGSSRSYCILPTDQAPGVAGSKLRPEHGELPMGNADGYFCARIATKGTDEHDRVRIAAVRLLEDDAAVSKHTSNGFGP